MRKLAAEFSEMHRDDLGLAFGQRVGTSVLLAARSWEPKAFRTLRRKQVHRSLGPKQLKK